MINKDRVQQWVDALRSGDFKQGKGVLHNSNTNTYCCLGVACAVAIEQGLEVDVHVEYGAGRRLNTYYDDNHVTLPQSVISYYGFGTDLPTVKGELLSDLNDKRGYTFSEIADAIEDEYLS